MENANIAVSYRPNNPRVCFLKFNAWLRIGELEDPGEAGGIHRDQGQPLTFFLWYLQIKHENLRLWSGTENCLILGGKGILKETLISWKVGLSDPGGLFQPKFWEFCKEKLTLMFSGRKNILVSKHSCLTWKQLSCHSWYRLPHGKIHFQAGFSFHRYEKSGGKWAVCA